MSRSSLNREWEKLRKEKSLSPGISKTGDHPKWEHQFLLPPSSSPLPPSPTTGENLHVWSTSFPLESPGMSVPWAHLRTCSCFQEGGIPVGTWETSWVVLRS